MKPEHRDLCESLARPRIVVVDGDPRFRRCAAALLAAHGFEVVAEAADGASALAAAQELRLDLARDSANAATGFVTANESGLATVQQMEARNRALLDAIPDTILRWGSDGVYLDIWPDALTAQLFPPEEFMGRSVRELLPDEVARIILAGIERALESCSMQVIEYEVPVRGEAHWREARIVPSGDGEVVAITRDFTEKRRADAELRRLVEEQAALRHVATLVASDAAPEQVFQLVTEEVCRLLDLRTAVLARFEDARTATIVGKFGDPTGPFEVGNVKALEVGSAEQVLQTGAPARSNYDEMAGEGAAALRALGFRGSVGVPITVAGVTWGALVVFQQEEPSRSRSSTACRRSRNWSVSPSQARAPTTSWPRRVSASSRPAMPNGAASSAICTTALNSGW